MGWRFCGWTTVKPAAGPLGCPPGPAGKRKKTVRSRAATRRGGPDRSAEVHRVRRTSPRSSQRLRGSIVRDGRRDVVDLSLEAGRCGLEIRDLRLERIDLGVHCGEAARLRQCRCCDEDNPYGDEKNASHEPSFTLFMDHEVSRGPKEDAIRRVTHR